MKHKEPGFIICGTDTDVGKTIISALFVQGLHATYWKPIQSGLENKTDTNVICKLLNLPKERWLPEAYKFKAAVSPHWSAELENRCIEINRLKIPSFTYPPLIIETAGGLMVPLTRNYLQINHLKQWQYPIILVGRSGLGTINHTLLSLEALKARKIPVIGIVLNGPIHKDNPKTIEKLGGVPVICQFPALKEITSESLSEIWINNNMDSIFESLISKF